MAPPNQAGAKARIAPAGLVFLAITSVGGGFNWPITKFLLGFLPPSDPRVKVAVGYVPYAGQVFLPAFCESLLREEALEAGLDPFFVTASQADRVLPRISQQTLAEMIGTTRSRVNFFMNKFKRLGFIDYRGGLTINNSLASVLLRDERPAAQPSAW